MKKLEGAKTFQLVVFAALSLLCFYLIAIKSNVYHLIAESRELQLVCALLWVTLFAAFVFVFIDFSLYAKQKSAYNALDYAVHSDALAKIANRQGIDEVIEKYLDKPLPDNVGCAMFLLTSLNEINRRSRSEGNAQIRNFSIILKLASTDICFVGRNGGNVFLAIFEDTNEVKVDTFMERVEEKVKEHNQNKKNLPMYYQYGLAFREEPPIETINGLISLSSKRAHDAKTSPSNISYIDEKRIRAKIAAKSGKTHDIDDKVATSDNKAKTETPAIPVSPISSNVEDAEVKIVESNSEYGLPDFIIVLSDYKKEHIEKEETVSESEANETTASESKPEDSRKESETKVSEVIEIEESAPKARVVADLHESEDGSYKYSYEEVFSSDDIDEDNYYYDDDKEVYTEAI